MNKKDKQMLIILGIIVLIIFLIFHNINKKEASLDRLTMTRISTVQNNNVDMSYSFNIPSSITYWGVSIEERITEGNCTFSDNTKLRREVILSNNSNDITKHYLINLINNISICKLEGDYQFGISPLQTFSSLTFGSEENSTPTPEPTPTLSPEPTQTPNPTISPTISPTPTSPSGGGNSNPTPTPTKKPTIEPITCPIYKNYNGVECVFNWGFGLFILMIVVVLYLIITRRGKRK
jgi:hypothetical protein